MQAVVIKKENPTLVEEVYIKVEPPEEPSTVFGINQSVMIQIKKEEEEASVNPEFYPEVVMAPPATNHPKKRKGVKARVSKPQTPKHFELKPQRSKVVESNVPKPNKDKDYPCRYCTKVYKSYNGCLEHEKTHTEEIPICKICKKSYSSQGNLYAHMKTHTSRRFQCDLCLMEFVYKQTLKKHIMGKHLNQNYDRVQCGICKKFYIKGGHITRHIENVHLKYKNFECDVCGARYSERSSLTTHLALKHGKVTGGVRFSCDICKVPYFSRSDFEAHKKTHRLITTKTIKDKKREPIRVNIFESTQEFLNSNIIVKEELIIDDGHDDPNDTNLGINQNHNEKYECKICFKTYGSENTFKYHQKLHTDGYYTCDLCGKEFTRKDSLQRHMTVTHVFHINRIICTRKPKQVSPSKGITLDPEELLKELESKKRKRRSRTEDGEKLKNFVCLYCGKKFDRSKLLEKHKKTHVVHGEAVNSDKGFVRDVQNKNVPNLSDEVVDIGFGASW